MGVLPLQFKDGTTAQTLKLDGSETYDVVGLDANIKPQQDLTLKITRKDGSVENVPSVAALIRPSRSTTTSTAASCRMCCASCVASNIAPRPQPKLRAAGVVRHAKSPPRVGSRLANSALQNHAKLEVLFCRTNK
jgi:hypothetical protein